MLISSKLFIRHLSIPIIGIESAGKGAATERSQAVIAGKRINERASFVYILDSVHEFFLSAESGFKSFAKGNC